MGRGRRRAEDDWEGDADAIAAERSVLEPGAALEALFADLIRRGLAAEPEYDAATDALASGERTEAELLAEWKARASRSEDPAGASVKKDKKKTHKKENAVSSIDADAKGVEDGTVSDNESKTEPIGESERHLDEWRQAACNEPKSLPLAGMTGVCLFGAYGVSTHSDRMVRLWDGMTGRRLGAQQHKHDLSACTAANGVIAVGDTTGAVYIYGTETEFLPLRLSPLPGGAIRSIALQPLSSSSSLAVVSCNGTLTAWLGTSETWPPAQMSRTSLPLHGLEGCSGDIHLANGASCSLMLSVGRTVAAYDLQSATAVWSAQGGNWPESQPELQPEWRGEWDPSAVSSLLNRVGGSASRGLCSSTPPKPGCETMQQPSRPISYSPFWKLLAAAVNDDAVALWDLRTRADRGAAAAIGVERGTHWLHLDEGQSMAGHLVVAPSIGGAVHVYDVRRLAASREASAVRSVVSLPVPSAATTPCFAAQGIALVVGGGHGCSEVWRYGGAIQEDEQEEINEARPTPATRTKPKRQVNTSQRRMFNRTK